MDEENDQLHLGEISHLKSTSMEAKAGTPYDPQVVPVQMEAEIADLRLDATPTAIAKQLSDAMHWELHRADGGRDDEWTANEDYGGNNGFESADGSGTSPDTSPPAYIRSARKSALLYSNHHSGGIVVTSPETSPGSVQRKTGWASTSLADSGGSRSTSISYHIPHDTTPEGSPPPSSPSKPQNPNTATSTIAGRIVTDPALRAMVESYTKQQAMHGATGYIITITVTAPFPRKSLTVTLGSSSDDDNKVANDVVNDPSCPRCGRLGKECKGGRPCTECVRAGKTDLEAKLCLKAAAKDSDGKDEGWKK